MAIFAARNFIHTITYSRPSATIDGNGDPATVAAQTTVTARVQAARRLVRDMDRKEIVSMHTIYTAADIRNGDRVWIPHLGDDVTNAGHARHVLEVTSSERLRGGGERLVTVYL